MSNKDVERSIKAMEKALHGVGDLLSAADPEAVFSKPIEVGEYTIITASEVGVGGGLGYGTGLDERDDEEGVSADEKEFGARFGGGAGGGGGSGGRPVAIITVGPDGLDVQPVIDITKLGLAVLTTIGSMALTLSKIRKSN